MPVSGARYSAARARADLTAQARRTYLSRVRIYLAWLSAAALLGRYMLAVSPVPFAMIVTVIVALVMAMHHENIARLQGFPNDLPQALGCRRAP